MVQQTSRPINPSGVMSLKRTTVTHEKNRQHRVCPVIGIMRVYVHSRSTSARRIIVTAMDTRLSEHIIKQYLISRNFTGTLDAFDAECNREKVRHRFQPSSITVSLRNAINESNLGRLTEIWSSLHKTFFYRLDADRQQMAHSFKVHVFKTYVVHAFSQKRTSKVTEFFDELSSEFCPNLPEWKNWYALPHTPDASEQPEYAMYFTKTWMDILSLSLTNFLCALFSLELCSTNVLSRLNELETQVLNSTDRTDKPPGLPTTSTTSPPFGKLLDDFNELGSLRPTAVTRPRDSQI
ncbi:WD repeat-containing protein 91 [Clonorchis sinensis]|uniref:WD repeat-containing protein 91 n=1 Tax=Clonorchis sinensis TaxID=79923 RepID=A0A419QFS5_CLOSI|nr:WD repeat-containing protein 91 [Clonorchis sinensis]